MADSKLRLHRDEESNHAHGSSHSKTVHRPQPKEVLPFPAAYVRRQALVAGKVNKRASDGHDFKPRVTESAEKANTRTQNFDSTDDIISNVEATLERMQQRLDHFKRDAEETFRFPTLGDDDDGRPRAA